MTMVKNLNVEFGAITSDNVEQVGTMLRRYPIGIQVRFSNLPLQNLFTASKSESGLLSSAIPRNVLQGCRREEGRRTLQIRLLEWFRCWCCVRKSRKCRRRRATTALYNDSWSPSSVQGSRYWNAVDPVDFRSFREQQRWRICKG